jgi:hypothetical protein
MAFLKFGKTVKHQRFNYIPRYYDPAKEERDARIKAAMGMAGSDPEAMKARIRNNIRDRHRGNRKTDILARRRSNLILIAVLLGLIWLTYYVLSRFMPAIEKIVD